MGKISAYLPTQATEAPEIEGIERERWGIGKRFHEIANEFKGRTDELHEIALAIRKNQQYFISCNFGQVEENIGFPEGALLSHLHRIIEKRDSAKYPKSQRCSICQIDMDRIYNGCSEYIEYHLLAPVVQLDANKKYGIDDFIAVCPNCHAVLHRYRPWRVRETIIDILR